MRLMESYLRKKESVVRCPSVPKPSRRRAAEVGVVSDNVGEPEAVGAGEVDRVIDEEPCVPRNVWLAAMSAVVTSMTLKGNRRSFSTSLM